MVSASSAFQTLIILALFLLQASGSLESIFPPLTKNCGNRNVRDRKMLSKIRAVQFEVAALTPLFGFVHTKINGVVANGRCQGDLNSETCSACIVSAVTTLQQYCPYSEMSRTWMEKCYVDYSTDEKNLVEGKLGFAHALCSQTRLSIPRHIFERRMTLMLNSTIQAAIDDDKRFAWKETQLSKTLFMQGMAQCNGDYTRDMCLGCLDSAFRKGTRSCWEMEGFHIMGKGCVLRLENYSFINTKYDP